MKVGLTYNLKKTPKNNELNDNYIEFDDEDTINAIKNALIKNGHEVIPIEADNNIFKKIKDTSPDIVFNIAEGIKGESRESHVPALLELLEIPYTGSGPLTLAIALNKAITNDILKYHNINTPRYQIFKKHNEKLSHLLTFPLIVKPIQEGSSKGIKNESLVKNEKDLMFQIKRVIDFYNQFAIVEEYIDGKEFTVSILGNDPPIILPLVEIDFNQLPVSANKIYSYEAKWIWDTPEKPIEMFKCPAELDMHTQKNISNIALKVFNILGCKDICRIDGRLNKKGQFYVLDVNPLPGFIPDPKAHSCFPESAIAANYTYDELINTILFCAIKRYKLEHLLHNNFITPK